MRVVFLVVDALPVRHVNAATTPVLAALADSGASTTGRSVMTSSTYPNHATFVTGVDPVGHGILANWVVRDGTPRATWKLGPSAPTIFDAAHAAGRSSAAVFGDHRLIGVMGARAADMHWPLDGKVPEDLPTDDHGYVYDDAVLEQLVPLLDVPDGPDLVVGHLNEPDTVAHVHGPDTDAAIATYRSTDAHVQPILDALRRRWDDTVLMVVSDHDQETVTVEEPIDLHAAAAAAGIDAFVMPELSGAVVWGDDPLAGAWLDAVDGVAGHAEAWPGARVVWSEAGHWFAMPPEIREHTGTEKGQHGGATTRNQVAIVAGGHPAAQQIGTAIGARQLEAADWAATIAGILDLDLSGATGRNLSGSGS
jgi:arylsulfatase A-like enzyme